MVFFYTTEYINYYQRKEAFQVNLAAYRIQSLPNVRDKVHFYSYDITTNGLPNGLPFMSSPVTDLTGKDEKRTADLPAIWFWPLSHSGKKGEQIRYNNWPDAEHIIKFIKEVSIQDLYELDPKEYGSFGVRDKDVDMFHKRLKIEGVVTKVAGPDDAIPFGESYNDDL